MGLGGILTSALPAKEPCLCRGVIFPLGGESHGRRLAASLLQTEVSPDPEWSELEQSALGEMGMSNSRGKKWHGYSAR